MLILAIDTAAGLCAAAVHDTQAGERGRAVLDLGKGHAEHLIGVIEDALAAAGASYANLGAVAVSVGPGSFTGLRVGVATARGLALALALPALGIGTLEAIAHQARVARPGQPVLCLIEAGRGQVYAAAYDGDGALIMAPAALARQEAAVIAGQRPYLLAGSAAAAIASETAPQAAILDITTPDIASYAVLAAQRLGKGAPFPPAPVPLYLREADAKVQEGFALPRRDGQDGA